METFIQLFNNKHYGTVDGKVIYNLIGQEPPQKLNHQKTEKNRSCFIIYIFFCSCPKIWKNKMGNRN